MDKIIQGDALTVLKTLPDESIDMVLTSPPYDNLRTYGGYTFNFEGIAKELYRVIKNGGVVVWVVGDSVVDGSETGTSFRQALYFKEIGFNLHDTMIYEKCGCPYQDPTRYLQMFEYMFVFSKGKPKTINLIKDRKNRWDKTFGCVTNRKKDGSLQKVGVKTFKEYGARYNIWRINAGYGRSTEDNYSFEHPATFPEELATAHILSWSNKDDLVLDPMCGSGTTLKMAKCLGRNYIGIEIEQKYIKIAEKRLQQEYLPL